MPRLRWSARSFSTIKLPGANRARNLRALIGLAGSVYAAEKPAEIPSQRYDGDG